MNYSELQNTIYSQNKRMSGQKKGLIIFLVVVLVLLAFMFGRLAGRKEGQVTVVSEPTNEEYGNVENKSAVAPEYFKNDVNFKIFWEVWNKIQTEYIDRPVAEPQLFYGALMGMVASLGDPYSVFLEPEISQDFQEELKGRFEGIGAEIAVKNNRLVIVSPLPDSPAEKAGLKAGDKVFFIDDYDTTGISTNEAVNRIRGDKGTQVKLTVIRNGESDYREIWITRDTIKIVSASWEMKEINNKKIAVIDLSNFNQDTNSLLIQAITEILASGPDGVVLDLRGNPGGYIDQAISIASHWVSAGKIVVSEDFGRSDKLEHPANGNAELASFKTVVLINKGSASASEIVAGALKDYGLAEVIGETSFGKGSVQNLEELEDGSSIKLTIARWLTPDGHQINDVGIDPDEIVELTEDDWNNDLDPQMDRALESLTQ